MKSKHRKNKRRIFKNSDGSHLYKPGQSGNPAGRPKGCGKNGRRVIMEAIDAVLKEPEVVNGIQKAIREVFQDKKMSGRKKADFLKTMTKLGFIQNVLTPLIPKSVMASTAEDEETKQRSRPKITLDAVEDAETPPENNNESENDNDED